MDNNKMIPIVLNCMNYNLNEDDDDDEITEAILFSYKHKTRRVCIQGYAEMVVPNYTLCGKY